MDHKGKVAYVTGAGRGIGLAIAKRLAEEGADVVCLSATEANAKKAAREVQALGRKAIGIGCDVSNSEQVQEAFERASKELGPPNYLINNAGIAKDQLIVRMKDEDWDRVMDVNLKGAFLCTRQATRDMMKARFGRIVNVSSIIGLGGQVAQANYAASKAGLLGLTMSVAKELGGRGITCNAVAPGYIVTDMTDELPEQFKTWAAETAPVKRLGTPEDIAGVVSFLCSEDASFITGQTLVIDGGLTL